MQFRSGSSESRKFGKIRGKNLQLCPRAGLPLPFFVIPHAYSSPRSFWSFWYVYKINQILHIPLSHTKGQVFKLGDSSNNQKYNACFFASITSKMWVGFWLNTEKYFISEIPKNDQWQERNLFCKTALEFSKKALC